VDEVGGDATTPRDPDFVQSLERGLAVLRSFDADHPAATLSDVARRTGLTRAGARRLLRTLGTLGYVRSDGRLFSLTPRVLELGYAYLSSMSLPEIAEPHLEHLAAELHESASVSVLDGTDIVYVARVATSRIMRVAITVGTRFPAHCTSMGRVLLGALPPDRLDAYLASADLERRTRYTITDPQELRAELARAAARGHALVDQELEEGLRSLAVPLHDADGVVVAAVNVSTQAGRTTREQLRRDVLPQLQATARAIEQDVRAAGTGGRNAPPA
jgi:IclR family pca regulon transcriptional regulator